MTSDFLSTVANAWPASIWQDVPVMVGVSGGADSVALLRALGHLKPPTSRGTLIVAHFDHNLRDDSADHAAFVAGLAKQFGWEFLTERALACSHASEATSRDQRYQFFGRAADQAGARYLVLAHTQDDNVETILHRILRGTGLRGLGGIPFTRRFTEMTTIVRPLLGTTRARITEFLQELNQTFCTDPSNTDLAYTRNRIRHELLPHLEERYNAGVRHALLRLADHASDARQTLQGSAQNLMEAAITHSNSTAAIDCESVQLNHRVVVTEMLRLLWQTMDWNEQSMTNDAWRQLCNCCFEPTPPFELPGAIRVERDGRWLTLTS